MVSSPPHLFQRCVRLLRPHWRLFAMMAACMLLLSLLQLPGPVLTMKAIDAATARGGSPSAALVHMACVVLLVTLLAARLVRIAQSFMLERFKFRVILSLQRSLFTQTLQLPLSYHLKFPHGYMMSRVNEDPYRIQGIMADSVLSIFGDFITLLVGIGFLFYLHWFLALISVLALPLLVLLFVRLRTSLKDEFTRSHEKSAQVNRFLGESLANVFTIKAFSLEATSRRRFARHLADLARQQVRIQRRRLTYENTIGLLTGLVPIVILWYGALEIVRGHLSVGEFIAFNGFLAYLYRPAEGIVIALLSLQGSLSAIERIFEVLDTPREDYAGSPEEPRAPRLLAPSGVPALQFRDVSFHYPGKSESVLRNVTFSIRRGELIAVTGPSGVGKTTLLSLIPRLVEPSQGSVLVHGTDNRGIPLSRLRRIVTVASLETRLFSLSVSENIRCGSRASLAEVIEAARIACAEEFVRSLPDGFDTPLGEGGVDLSAGQRQRLLIARALVRKPELLLLDEATAFLDPELESEVLGNIRRTCRNRTVLCVSHRPSILRFADRLLLLDQGRVREGTGLEAALPATVPVFEVAAAP